MDLHGFAVNDHLCFPQHAVSFHQFLSAGWVMLGLRHHSCLVCENEPDRESNADAGEMPGMQALMPGVHWSSKVGA